jgi:hypothetical protein
VRPWDGELLRWERACWPLPILAALTCSFNPTTKRDVKHLPLWTVASSLLSLWTATRFGISNVAVTILSLAAL